MPRLHFKKAFTLIELLIVITLIGLLAVVGVTQFLGSQAKARDARRISDVSALKQSIDLYFVNHTVVPNDLPHDLNREDDLETKLGGIYISQIPNDPRPVDDSYRYVYYLGEQNSRPAQLFELNVRLESWTNNSKETGDGGNNDDVFETGNGIASLGAEQTIDVAVPTTCSSIQWENTQEGSGGCAEGGEGEGGDGDGGDEDGGGEENEDLTDLDCSTGQPFCNGLVPTVCVENGMIIRNGEVMGAYAGVLNGGTQGNVIVGTEDADEIHGGNGTDTICGFGGNDTIDGQNGGDWIDGGEGDDVITGGTGTDYIDGGAGIDTANGANGNDQCPNVENPVSCTP